MSYRWRKAPKVILITSLSLLLLAILACGGTASTPMVVEKEVVKEVIKEIAIEKEVIKEVPKEVVVEKEVIKEVIKEVVVVATPVPVTQAVSPAGDKLNRLIVAITPIGFDTNYSYKVTSSGLLDKRPVNEWLIGTDSATGAMIPQLATEWEMSPNGKDWTIKLREGIQWHDGWGEFTAKDVAHSLWLIVQPESSANAVGTWRMMAGIEKGASIEATTQKVNETIEIVDDHTLIFHGAKPQPELDQKMSYRLNWLMESKARWDAVGHEGYGEAIVGTGPLKFIERVEGVHVRYEAIDDHWRISPDYKELEFRWVPESATRMAALLAEEVHLSDIERAARAEALARGMTIIPSSTSGMQVRTFFGGQYYTQPELLDQSNPLLDIKVRQAMNKAIDRQTIVDTLLVGSTVLMPHIFPFHPQLDEDLWPGIFNQDWLDRYDEMYGYDPERAKELLDEAGYPNGFESTIYLAPLSGLPEIPDIGQAMALDFESIGLKPKLVNLEFSKIKAKYKGQKMSNEMYVVRGGNSTLTYMSLYYPTKSSGHAYHTEELDALWAELGQTLDRKNRTRILREMGDTTYNEFASILMFALSTEILANPKFVAEYKFPGDTSGFFTHLEQIKTVPQ